MSPYADEASRRYEEQERVAQRNALEDLEAMKTRLADLKADRDRILNAALDAMLQDFANEKENEALRQALIESEENGIEREET